MLCKMKAFSKSLLFFFVGFLVERTYTSVCVDKYETKENDLCFDCSFDHFREYGVQNLVKPSDCQKRSNEFLHLDLYVSNQTCSSDEACDGSDVSPCDSLGKALVFAHRQANRRIFSEINVFLIGDVHFLLRNSLEEEANRLFKRVNATVRLAPLLCSQRALPGCFSQEDARALIIVKSENFSLFVTRSLRIKNIIFQANDIHIINATNPKIENDCFNLKRICCDSNSLGLLSTANSCGLYKKTQVFLPHQVWSEKFGLITLEPIPDDPLSKDLAPTLEIINSAFNDFYPLKTNYGWISLIVGNNAGAINISLSFVTIKNVRFLKGILWISDYTTVNSADKGDITSMLIKNSGEKRSVAIINCIFQNYDFYNISGMPAGNENGLFIIKNFPGNISFQLSQFSNQFNSVETYAFLFLTNCSSVTLNSSLLRNVRNFNVLKANFSTITLVNASFLTVYLKLGFSLQSSLISWLSCAFSAVDNSISGGVFFSLTRGAFSMQKTQLTDCISLSFSVYYCASPAIIKEVNLTRLTRKLFYFENTPLNINQIRSISSSHSGSSNYFIRIVNFGPEMLSILISNIYVFNQSLSSSSSSLFDLMNMNTGDQLFAQHIYIEKSTVKYIFISYTISQVNLFNATVLDTSKYGAMLLDLENYKTLNLRMVLMKNIYMSGNILYLSCSYDCDTTIEGFVGKELNVLVPTAIRIFYQNNLKINDFAFNPKVWSTYEPSQTQLIMFIYSKNTSFSNAIFETSQFPCSNIILSLDEISMFANMTFIQDPSLPAQPCVFCHVTQGNYVAFDNITLNNIKGYTDENNIMKKSGIISIVYNSNENIPIPGKNINILKNIQIIDCSSSYYGLLGLINLHKVKMINITVRSRAQIPAFTVIGGGFTALWVDFLEAYNINISNVVSDKSPGFYILGTQQLSMNGIFIYNTTSAKSKYGGTIGLEKVEKANLTLISLNNSTAKYTTGGIFAVESTLLIENLTIENIDSGADAGAFNLFKCGLNLKNIIASNIKAKKGGLVLASNLEFLTLSNLIFKNSMIKEMGLVLALIKVKNITITDAAIEDCTASEGFGAIFIKNEKSSTSYFKNLTFYRISAAMYSCFYVQSDDNITFEDIKIIRNEGTLLQILGRRKAFVSMKNINILDNIEKANAAAISFYRVNLNFTGDNKIEGNSFERDLINIESGEAFLQKIEFYDNNCTKEGTLINTAASILVLNNVIFNNKKNVDSQRMSSFLNAAEGKISISSTKITNCVNFEHPACLVIRKAGVYIIHSIFENNQGSTSGALYTSEADIHLKSCSFINKPGSSQQINNNNFELHSSCAISADNSLITRGFSFVVEQVNFEMSCSGKPTLLTIRYESLRISDSSFSSGSISELGEGIYLEGTNLFINKTLFKNLFSINGAAIKMINTDMNLPIELEILDSEFKENRAFVGGAVLLKGKLRGIFSDNKFVGNKAVNESENKKSGIAGCIYYSCMDCLNSKLIFNKNLFENNKADFFAPTIFSQNRIETDQMNTFINNNDGLSFTKNYSTLPLTLHVSDLRFKNPLYGEIGGKSPYTLISGAPFDFSISLMDSQGQILLYDSISLPSVELALNASGTLSKQNTKISSGIQSLDSVKVSSYPGESVNLSLKIGFSELTLLPFIVEEYANNNNTFVLSTSVRKCEIGELYVSGDQSCEICPRGFYSLADPMLSNSLNQKCKDCPENSFCMGGSAITPLRGYWRASANSSLLIECFSKESCLGIGSGYDTLNEAEKITGKCADHHSGNMCYQCDPGFARVRGRGLCVECRENLSVYLKLAISFIILIIYIAIQIRLCFKGTKNKYSGILFKQLLTHFQQIAIISLIDFGWTDDIKEVFSYQNYFSFISEELFSLDCIFAEFNFNNLMKNVLIFNILPLALILFFCALLMTNQLISCCRSKGLNMKLMATQIKISAIMSIYVLFPEILRKCFSLMNCVEIDDSTHRGVLLHSPDVICWSEYHISHTLIFSVPGIFIWGLLFPVGLAVIMYRNRNEIKKKIKYLSENSAHFHESVGNGSESDTKEIVGKGARPIDERKKNFSRISLGETSELQDDVCVVTRFVYKGYREDLYFWEIVIFAKKVLLIFVQSFTDFLPGKSKATFLLIVIIIFLMIQARYQPYELSYLNQIEYYSLLATFLSANLGVLLYSEDLLPAGPLFMALLVTINVLFVGFWTFVLVTVEKGSKAVGKKVESEREVPL